MKTSKEMEKYEWRPTASAPKYNPMQIHQGHLIFENGESIYIPSGHTLHQGWGKVGPTHVVGEDLKPIPIRLEIVWISYLEKKFYGGSFDLPSNLINNLFKEGFINRLGKKDTYGDINIGLAPGGMIVVWLLGGGKTIEVARFNASEVEVSIKEFAPSAVLSMDEFINSVLEEDFSEEVKAKMNPNAIPFGKWEHYRQKFSWKPSVNFYEKGTLQEIRMSFYNGENLYTLGSNKILSEFQEYAVPDEIRFEWADENNNEFGSRIYFNEEEIQEVFHTFFKNPNQKPAELTLKIDKYNGNIELALQNDSEKIEIKKARVKIYETSN
ncbi:DUF2931 family protein [uncultured Aquimarina sp.]|uniref:DUF2931 family protein n=1 Tax=uncultured Aquimarina sp. TaxID=575652 RepID=UPI0026223998|nr:DUF2931 family protein [uncultured Aquimarina sp.]